MIRKKPEFDVVNELLEQCILAYPVSSFVISLYKQYQERGSLSKKQLQGLFGKSSKIADIAPGKLATLEALINKMPTRDKSEVSHETKPLFEKDESTIKMIKEILAKYPQHKRVLFLQSKYENNEVFSPADITDLKRILQVVNK
jgi:predicted transcriptional regulator